MALFSDSRAARVGRCSIIFASAHPRCWRVTRDPWASTVGCQAGVLGLAWREGALTPTSAVGAAPHRLRHGQLLLPPVAVLVNRAGPCGERRVEERAALAWRPLAALAPAGCPGRWCRGSTRTDGPAEGVNKGVNKGVNGVNRGVNRGVNMRCFWCSGAAPVLGLCGKPTSPPRRCMVAKMGPHPHWGLPAVGVRHQLEVDPRREQVVQRRHVGGGRLGRPPPRPTGWRAARPDVGPLGELAVEAPARRRVARNGVRAHAKAGAGERRAAGGEYRPLRAPPMPAKSNWHRSVRGWVRCSAVRSGARRTLPLRSWVRPL
jgi:hypothetical protein